MFRQEAFATAKASCFICLHLQFYEYSVTFSDFRTFSSGLLDIHRKKVLQFYLVYSGGFKNG